MRISKESYDGMNALTAMCFNANAIIDNLAYSLDYHYYTKIADIVHHNVAHVMPMWADLITDEMLQLSARPIRKDIGGYSTDYNDLKEIFNVLMKTLLEIRGATKELIESADMNGDDEVRIFGEDFLMKIQPYIKQVDEWVTAANNIDPHTLNIHILDYTHFISL